MHSQIDRSWFLPTESPYKQGQHGLIQHVGCGLPLLSAGPKTNCGTLWALLRSIGGRVARECLPGLPYQPPPHPHTHPTTPHHTPPPPHTPHYYGMPLVLLFGNYRYLQIFEDISNSFTDILKGTPSIPETYLSSSVAWGLNLRVG